VLPASRALIAKKLIEKYNFTQVDAATKLGMTQSAMSRYLASERGRKIEVVKGIQRVVDKIAKEIVTNKLSQDAMVEKMCLICIAFRKSGEFCAIHRELVSTISKDCDLCAKIFEKEFGHKK
jgi:predicted transcriptional regulator